MDKVTRLLYKAKQLQNDGPDGKYIAWATVHPKDNEYEAQIMYYEDREADTKTKDVLKFKTRDEAADYVGALAEKHGQNKVLIIHFNF